LRFLGSRPPERQKSTWHPHGLAQAVSAGTTPFPFPLPPALLEPLLPPALLEPLLPPALLEPLLPPALLEPLLPPALPEPLLPVLVVPVSVVPVSVVPVSVVPVSVPVSVVPVPDVPEPVVPESVPPWRGSLLPELEPLSAALPELPPPTPGASVLGVLGAAAEEPPGALLDAGATGTARARDGVAGTGRAVRFGGDGAAVALRDGSVRRVVSVSCRGAVRVTWPEADVPETAAIAAASRTVWVIAMLAIGDGSASLGTGSGAPGTRAIAARSTTPGSGSESPEAVTSGIGSAASTASSAIGNQPDEGAGSLVIGLDGWASVVTAARSALTVLRASPHRGTGAVDVRRP
jgi:hypothetical protein